MINLNTHLNHITDLPFEDYVVQIRDHLTPHLKECLNDGFIKMDICYNVDDDINHSLTVTDSHSSDNEVKLDIKFSSDTGQLYIHSNLGVKSSFCDDFFLGVPKHDFYKLLCKLEESPGQNKHITHFTKDISFVCLMSVFWVNKLKIIFSDAKVIAEEYFNSNKAEILKRLESIIISKSHFSHEKLFAVALEPHQVTIGDVVDYLESKDPVLRSELLELYDLSKKYEKEKDQILLGLWFKNICDKYNRCSNLYDQIGKEDWLDRKLQTISQHILTEKLQVTEDINCDQFIFDKLKLKIDAILKVNPHIDMRSDCAKESL